MVKPTMTLVIALTASVIGTAIQTKVRRSVSNRNIRTLNEPLCGSYSVINSYCKLSFYHPEPSEVKL